MPRRLVLVPSPLLDATSWEPAADQLRRFGHDVAVAALDDGPAPLWRSHAESAARTVAAAGGPAVVVAHSGAGALLPAIAAAAGTRPAAAVYVDAGLPVDQTTRLEQLAIDAPDVATALRDSLAAGGRFPTWTDDDLAPLVPDPVARQRLLAGVRPRGQAFFTEPIPVAPAWWSVPAAYIRLSAAYDVWARMARDRGWPSEALDGGHFQLVSQPLEVARSIDAILGRLPATDATAGVRPEELRYDDHGLVPAVVQQHDTGEVLMVAWMNREALVDTMTGGETVFWSRSRGRRWRKGETSGNTQRVVEVVADCDGDVVLVRVDQRGDGVACHTGARSCFHRPLV